jgi:hypothetical protein
MEEDKEEVTLKGRMGVLYIQYISRAKQSQA